MERCNAFTNHPPSLCYGAASVGLPDVTLNESRVT